MGKLLKRLALVIGNNNYSNGRWIPLKYAVSDANAIANSLENLQFEVVSHNDVTSTNFIDIKEEVLKKLETGYEAFIFYFAGHGTIANASDCLLLCDAEDNVADTLVRNRSIVISDFMKDVNSIGNQMNIFIIDACRSYYTSNIRGGSISSNFGNNTNLPFQSFIAYASSPGQIAKENTALEHGAFTSSILRHIDEYNLSIEGLFKKVRNEIYTAMGKQLPWDYSCLVKSFCFNYGQNDKYFTKRYSQNAYEDKNYVSKIPEVNDIINKFRSYNYDTQVNALQALKRNYTKFSEEDLFVMGRNILQAANGNCWKCKAEISKNNLIKYTINGENHVLNGILYEIYFNCNDMLRQRVKCPEILNEIQL